MKSTQKSEIVIFKIILKKEKMNFKIAINKFKIYNLNLLLYKI